MTYEERAQLLKLEKKLRSGGDLAAADELQKIVADQPTRGWRRVVKEDVVEHTLQLKRPFLIRVTEWNRSFRGEMLCVLRNESECLFKTGPILELEAAKKVIANRATKILTDSLGRIKASL